MPNHKSRFAGVSVRSFFTFFSIVMCCAHLYAAKKTETVFQVGSPSSSAGEAEYLSALVLPRGQSQPVKPGQVIFEEDLTGSACALSVPSSPACVALGTAQLNLYNGGANLQVRLGVGPHRLVAHFLGTASYAPSLSAPQELTVVGTANISITSSGGPGNYTLKATATTQQSLPLAGTVTFIDQTNQDFVLATGTLGPAKVTQTFQSQVNYSAPLGRSVVTGDFNGDGIMDLAVMPFVSSPGISGSVYGTVSVFLGNPDGTFQPEQLSSTDCICYGGNAIVGDFNGDGVDDIAVVNELSELGSHQGSVSVLFGGLDGDGTLLNGGVYPVGNQAFPIASGDFNGDGIADLVVGNVQDNTISVLLGKLSGAFQAQTTFAVNSPSSIAVGDFNNDGIADLAVASLLNNTVSVLLGNGDGGFQKTITYSVGSAPLSVAIGDLNGDGILDLVVANLNDNTVSVLLGGSPGVVSFQQQKTYPAGAGPFSVRIGDFNDDGIPDLAVADAGGNTVSVLAGTGNGGFQAPSAYLAGSQPVSLAVGDFNGDGLPDLALANSGGGTVSVLLNQVRQSASVSLGEVFIPGGGVHSVVADYSDAGYYKDGDSNPILLGGSPIVAQLELSASPDSGAGAGQAVTLSASIDPSPDDNYSPTGQVMFYDNGALLGSGQLVNGKSTLAVTALPPGQNKLTAIYPGDGNFAKIHSNPYLLMVTANTGSIASRIPLR